MDETTPRDQGLPRRRVLQAGAAALTIAATGPQLVAPAQAQTPKRGGTLRMTVLSDPLHFDPHQTLSFVTMCPLSLVYSRLVKVKAGPSVKPMTYPIEPDLAESWTQPNETTYVFKLRKGVRWHPKPPVNGRELTADDVKYTYERFLSITGNPNKPVLEYIDRIEAVDKYTVKFTLTEPNAWFLALLASTSTWIIAKECVEKFGDLRKVESVVGTGPWMLERWEPNVKLVYVRNPNYFVPGLPDAVGVGQPGDEVVRVPNVDELDVRLPALEHPGPGADDRLDFPEVAELLDAFLRDDPGRGRGEKVQEPGVRFLERELDRVLVEGVDLVDVLEHRLVGVAGDREEPLVGVLDVIGRQLASVHWRLRVPVHALLQLEDVGRVVRLGPGLRKVELKGVGHRLDGRTSLHLQQAAVGKGERHHRRERERLVGIEVERVDLERQAQDAAALGCLRLHSAGPEVREDGGAGQSPRPR